jgi:hypothetical protein
MATEPVRDTARLQVPASVLQRSRSRSRSRVRRLVDKSRLVFYKHFRTEFRSRKRDEGESGYDEAALAWTKRLNEYEHEPLTSPLAIRVLTIKPDKDFNAPVEATITEVDLASDNGPYVALSHAWGPPDFARVLICDRRRVAITSRLDFALRRIRRKALEKEYRHWSSIWVDAVSIDQRRDVEAQLEKSKQVELMYEIFGRAQEVIVDLGRAGRLTPMLPKSLSDIDVFKVSSAGLSGTLEEAFYGIVELAFGEDEEYEGTQIVKSMAAIGKLFQREWFSRIWTFQEYALARDAQFMIGKYVG